MHPSLKTVLYLTLTLPLSACLFSKEEIEVRPDGSIFVRHSIEADVIDLSSGYALPLGPGWTPVNEAARIWIRELGANTGSAAVQALSARIDWPVVFREAGEDLELGDDDDDQVLLMMASEAEFASVEDWPRLYAPEDEPYRTAYLERSASLSIEDKGDRVVYVFERTFHGRRRAGLDLTERLGEMLSTTLVKEGLTNYRESIEQGTGLVPGDLTKLTELFADGHAELYVNLTRQTFEMAFAEGSGRLPLGAGSRCCAAVSAAIRGVFTERHVDDLWQKLMFASDTESTEGRPGYLEEEAPEDDNPLAGLEVDLRTILRDTVRDTLSAMDTPEQAVNEVAYALEWNLTEYDHTTDLQDENFEVVVSLPGTIVAGNYDSLGDDDAHATWEFEAKELMNRDRVMRAVSILAR